MADVACLGKEHLKQKSDPKFTSLQSKAQTMGLFDFAFLKFIFLETRFFEKLRIRVFDNLEYFE
jgi:hypothetical protein